LRRLSGVPLIGSLLPAGCASTPGTPDYLAELGVPRIINGAGVYTMFTGSLMLPECVEAIRQLSGSFVRLDELHDRVGERIAKLLGAEAAMVSSGAYGAMQLGTAACLTGTDPEKIQRIPDLEGMKSEVVTQKAHWFPYNHAVRNCGVKLIEVETRDEFEGAISEKTAMLLFLNKAENLGPIKMKEFVEIGKKHGIPTLNDAAADVPPAENLRKYVKL
ncbi:MAG: selenocysteine synthase, partial [bacterium]|nr:selenocysteine synthase [bacterium]